ncbi:MAG TPA: DUF3291 domain-containing protein [Dyella sp.]|uniref:DUF3291 domain-containing protein n=1 Tax=Dyella sp. TaxID=1869338 RepID=UPI002D788027|nr:DUF3291 domain-containing protein [Dyella sp.]HET6554262.1 DUF3291 domain-containing protein [Dyella sp.]
MARWQLAQMNVGTLLGDMGDPAVQPFFDALAEVNALAEASGGFVWRLKDDASDNATSIAVASDPRFLVNMSVWENAEALFDFVYRSAHTAIMAQRRQFFAKPPEGRAYQVLWWVPAGTEPTINDGLAKLWHLDRFGPTSLAFTFKQRFPAPDIAEPAYASL